MKTLNFIYFFLAFIILFGCSTTEEINNQIILKGKVFNRDSDTIFLANATDNIRVNRIVIPISENGEFEYKMPSSVFDEVYNLAFAEEIERGIWRQFSFIPENDTIFFEFFDDDSFKNTVIEGSSVDEREKELDNEYSTLFQNNYQYWQNKMFDIYKGDAEKSELPYIMSKLDSIQASGINWKLEKIKENPDVLSYFKFLQILRNESYQQTATTIDIYDLFQEKYPGHPYSRIAANFINKIDIGSDYIDFTAFDLNENKIILSNEIPKNQLTLVDIWAPWCEPCIAKSLKVRDAFDDLSPSGFDVVGVVGDINSEDEFKKVVNKFDYPWVTVKEINQENRLWEKYQIGIGGGKQFLVDQAGKIVAIDPGVDQIKKLLTDS